MVVLKATCPTGSRLVAGVPCPAQAPVVAQLKAAGAKILATTTLVDTLTAEVSPDQQSALSKWSLVSEVVPVVQVAAATSGIGGTSRAPAGSGESTKPQKGAYGGTEKASLGSHNVAPAAELCGTKTDPELDPQALQDITANRARAMGVTGSGVTVAVLADGIHPTNADFIRNAAYGVPGTHVVTKYLDFTGDGTGVKTGGGEAFGDASSIAAQANDVYNLARYVNPAIAALMPKSGCWVKVLGAAPGASLLMLQVFGSNEQGSNSGFIQAVQYAVQHGAKVINESFGADEFPDTGLDVIRDADDAAVAAGVTVVVSTGDGGPTNTIGSPASDPDVISVGATTNYRAYAQTDLGGFYNPAVGNGHWVSNNIASLSSAGFNEAGGTVDLVAPGDLNWALCSTNAKMYTDCADILGGKDIGVQAFGGTSEAAPLTSAAVADVIEAYSRYHHGASPSPALIKEILCSTATDIGAPGDEQGAGLLNIAGAVKLAESLPATVTTPPSSTTTSSTTSTTTPSGASTTTTTAVLGTTTSTTSTTVAAASTAPVAASARAQLSSHLSPQQTSTPLSAAPLGDLLVSPNQLDVVGQEGAATPEVLSLTNTGTAAQTVRLSSRELDHEVYSTGSRQFTMDPSKPSTNLGAFPIWSGVDEVYQTEHFQVPVSGSSRLVFSADYQHTNQTSQLHVTLFEPDGTFAAYSDPQGQADYAEVEVADPPAGKWTALFFTEQNGALKGGIGTSGPVQWDASVWDYTKGPSLTPSVLSIAPGQTATAALSVVNPHRPGDTSESIVISTPAGRTTVPVAVRTMIPISADGGAFGGVLSGGNGRQETAAQINTYFFDVPKGKSDIEASIALSTDPDEGLVGYLVDPDGQTVGYSSNYTLVPSGSSFEPTAPAVLVPGTTPYLEMYHAAPQAGTWELVLQWENPVTGNELAEGFQGAITFNQVLLAESGLPTSGTKTLARGKTTTAVVLIANTGVAPAAFFADPRLDRETTIPLKNLSPGTSATKLRLPRPPNITPPLGIPFYLVPPGTTELKASVTRLSGSGPVSFDMGPLEGDPDISPEVTATGVSGTGTSSSASLSFSKPEVSPGIWAVVPDEVGPYAPTGAPKEFVDTKLSAVTQAFDPGMRTNSDDLWQVGFSFSKFYYVQPDQIAEIKVTIKPTAPVGTKVSGTLYVDAFTLYSFANIQALWPDADVVAALPYSYTVGAPAS